MNQNANSPFDENFYNSIKNELFNDILPFWEKYSRDLRPGFEGFFGAIDNSGKPDLSLPRSIVMTARFLWTYSAVARYTKNPTFLEMADFACKVIISKYWDFQNGGVYWSVFPDGRPCVSKKQIYGQAFCCYGLCEYAAALKELREDRGGESLPHAPVADASCATPSNGGSAPVTPPLLSEVAMNYALEIFRLLEKHAFDTFAGGYLEACAQDWTSTDDMMLSPKDMNCSKSMNTNLHVMEAYTNLYRTLQVVFPDSKELRKGVGASLTSLVIITVKKILQPNVHLGMYFDMNWKLLSDEISYGHDIEASWLLWEAACELNDEELKSEIRGIVIHMAEIALLEGFDNINGCMENYLRSETKGRVRDRTRVWWNQAEAMNGFYNAWEMTGDSKFSDACLSQWNWILNNQKDKKGGEWWNEVDVNGIPILSEDKGGNWKTSYHNGRTCLEILQRFFQKKLKKF